MAVDFWADKYWNGQYFNTRYFGAGEEVAGAMVASLNGSGGISASLTAVEVPVQQPVGRGGTSRRRQARNWESEITIRTVEPVLANIAASLSGKGGAAAEITAAANLAASIGGGGKVQAQATARRRGHVIEDNNFWTLAA